MRVFFLFLFFSFSLAGVLFATSNNFTAPVYKAEILAEKRYEPEVFTQGLFLKDGKLYESSGLYEKSFLIKWNFDENKDIPVIEDKKIKFAGEIFAEGITLVNNKIYLLTWQEEKLFIINSQNFEIEKILNYKGDGWGLCYNGENLWRSDGTSKLYLHKPSDFSEIKEIIVKDGGREITMLNELEYDFENNLIIANIFQTNYIVVIDPEKALVKAWIDATELSEKRENFADNNYVLNGIALAEDNKSLWLRGKYWNTIYKIKWPLVD